MVLAGQLAGRVDQCLGKFTPTIPKEANALENGRGFLSFDITQDKILNLDLAEGFYWENT